VAVQVATVLASTVATLVVLQLISVLLARATQRLLGRRLWLVLFGWLGTIVHEGAHVAACLLCGHRVLRIRWFDPWEREGSLGSAEHGYDSRSVVHQMGNVVIGIAPLVVGAALIALAAWHLLGVRDFRAWSIAWRSVPLWQSALFVYLSVSIGSSMQLSRSDLRGTSRGAVLLSLLLFVLCFVIGVAQPRI